MSIGSPTRFSAAASNYSRYVPAKTSETVRFGSGASAADTAASAAASGANLSNGAVIGICSAVGVVVVGLLACCLGKRMRRSKLDHIPNHQNTRQNDVERGIRMENRQQPVASIQRPKKVWAP